MALFRSTINVVGYFDERLGPGIAFPAAEDNDFGLRLLRAGYQVQYVPAATVDHIAWRSRNEYLPLQWRYGKGQGAYYAKHLSIREPRVAVRLARDLLRPLVSGVLCIWWKERFGGAFFCVGVGVGCVQWLVRERFGLLNAKQDSHIEASTMDWGGLRRTEPISREFGYDRGTPIDRYYIEQFLGASASAITGRVLEVGDDTYTRRFGGSRVTVGDVLHVSETNPDATIIGDLSTDGTIPAEVFDCAIITQTLHLIFEPHSALTNLHRSLKRGGTLLATVPGITPVSSDEWKDTWYWAFTISSVRRMFGDVFGPAAVDVQAHGNVFAALCFLQGIAVEDVTPAELDARDPNYDVLITVRARKVDPGDRLVTGPPVVVA